MPQKQKKSAPVLALGSVVSVNGDVAVVSAILRGGRDISVTFYDGTRGVYPKENVRPEPDYGPRPIHRKPRGRPSRRF
jgi:hypothetical protein